jgi:patatin-like phospholipase/acyl hydrolase
MKSKVIVLFSVIAFLLFQGCNDTKQTSENPLPEAVKGSETKYTLLLTIDGGGVKGIVPATILAQLESDFKKPIYRMFDVIGGTSTGGIITVGLTTPKIPSNVSASVPRTAVEIQNIYLDSCNKILFPVPDDDTGPDYYADRAKSVYFGMTYPAGGIERYLQGLTGATYTMKEAHDNMLKLPSSRVREIFTTCYVVNGKGGAIQSKPTLGENYGPYQFTWSNALNTSKNENYYAWEAARGTSAAPTFFPVAHVGGGTYTRSTAQERWVIDGGLVTNNPIMTGLDMIRTKNGNLDNVVAVSLGCGINYFNAGVGVTNEATHSSDHHKSGQKYGFWNTDDWVVKDLYNLNEDEVGRGRILELLMYANQFTADSQFENMISNNEIEAGIRIQPTLPQHINQSFDCTMVNDLKQATSDYITKDPKGIKEYAKLKQLLAMYL